MPDLTVSADIDAFMQAANDAAARTELGLTALATTTPGTGVATALAANVGSAGAPVLFNGAGGTPSSIVLTNATGTAAGLTAGTASAVAVGGITGLGTGVGAALAANVGSAGAPVLFNGAGGTPSSMVGTNITGTAAGLTAGTASAVAVGGITGLGADVGNLLAVFSSANLLAALTTSTGTGVNVFGTSPAFTTNFTLANGASPTTSSVAQMAFDTDAWAASRGAVAVHDGTATTWLVGVLASDTPSNGQVPTWNTGGTITWETPGGAANAVTAASAAAGAGLFWVSGGADRTATATDTVTTVNATNANVDTLKILDAVDQSHGLSFIVSSNLAADKTFTYTGAFNFTMTLSADTSVTFPTSGTLLTTTGSGASLTALAPANIAAGVLGGNITLGESAGQIILDPTLSADGTWSGIMMAGTAGAALAFGDLIYLAAADSRWELADADAASTSGDVVLGMCVLAAAADGDPTNVLLFGKIRADAAFPALTIGAPAYVGTTAGDIQVAQPSGADDVIRVVGYAHTADVLIFNPSGFYITHT